MLKNKCIVHFDIDLAVFRNTKYNLVNNNKIMASQCDAYKNATQQIIGPLIDGDRAKQIDPMYTEFIA